MTRHTDGATLPGGYARELVDLCARFDVRPLDLCGGLDLSLESLADPVTRVGLATFTQLVRRAEALTGEPGLAYYAGCTCACRGTASWGSRR